MTRDSHRRTGLYGAFAFACIVLSCFSLFLLTDQIDGTESQLALTFILGAAYAILGVLDSTLIGYGNPRVGVAIFLLEAVLVTLLLFLCPLHGMFGIIVLPLVSVAIFQFSPRWATVAGIYAYGVSAGVFWKYYDPRTALAVSITWLPAFAFTAAFTIVAKQAVGARDQAERLSGELTDANNQLRAHSLQAEELATTRERNRLAREIHDGVGHHLTVVKVQLDAAAALLPAQPDRARAAIEKAARLAADALDEVRRSVRTLHREEPRPPLMQTLRALATTAEPPPAFEVIGTPRELSAAAEHALYRAAQEGLTNIRKHARASTATLLLDYQSAARVTLSVVDDGRGAPSPVIPGGGFGLQGLRERVEILGGRVSAGNQPPRGFALVVELPA